MYRSSEQTQTTVTQASLLVIPDDALLINLIDQNRESVLKFDSGTNDDRIIILSTQRSLDYLQGCSDLYGDGTFSVAPPIFDQLYTIYRFINRTLQPLIYAILTGRSNAVCRRLLQAV